MIEKDIAEHFDQVNRIAAEYLKGKNETQISQELDIPRSRVSKYLMEWKSAASNSEAIRARARDALAGADFHYNNLIREAYALIEEATTANQDDDLSTNQMLAHRHTALKMIADLEKSRIDMLQKAGLLENQELADQLIEQEKQHEAIMGIITEVVGTCKTCKPRVLQRMSGIGDGVTIIEGDIG